MNQLLQPALHFLFLISLQQRFKMSDFVWKLQHHALCYKWELAIERNNFKAGRALRASFGHIAFIFHTCIFPLAGRKFHKMVFKKAHPINDFKPAKFALANLFYLFIFWCKCFTPWLLCSHFNLETVVYQSQVWWLSKYPIMWFIVANSNHFVITVSMVNIFVL